MAIKKVELDARKEVKIGMLGYGFMGKCHTNAYKKIPYIYSAANVMPRLLIICGRNEENVKREAARYGYEEYCTDWNELVNDDRIDIFDNCGPDHYHPEPCIAALKNGKNVICEKPMALSLDDAKRMRDEANLAKGKAMCVFNYRFMPAVRFAKDLIAEGKIGKIYHIRVNYLQMAGHDPSIPPDEVWYSGRSHSGIIQGIGSHAIDQCRFLLGEIKSVSALVRTFNEERAIPTIGCKDAVADDQQAVADEILGAAEKYDAQQNLEGAR